MPPPVLLPGEEDEDSRDLTVYEDRTTVSSVKNSVIMKSGDAKEMSPLSQVEGGGLSEFSFRVFRDVIMVNEWHRFCTASVRAVIKIARLAKDAFTMSEALPHLFSSKLTVPLRSRSDPFPLSFPFFPVAALHPLRRFKKTPPSLQEG